MGMKILILSLVILLLLVFPACAVDIEVEYPQKAKLSQNSTSDIYITKIGSNGRILTYEGVPMKILLSDKGNMVVFEDGVTMFPLQDLKIRLIQLGRVNRVVFVKNFLDRGYRIDSVSYP